MSSIVVLSVGCSVRMAGWYLILRHIVSPLPLNSTLISGLGVSHLL